MDDVLNTYIQPANPQRPLVCMDEASKQLLADKQVPLPMKPGQLERFDYEYEREGVANLFMFLAPLDGKRNLKVTDCRTRDDWAEAMRELSDVH